MKDEKDFEIEGLEFLVNTDQECFWEIYELDGQIFIQYFFLLFSFFQTTRSISKALAQEVHILLLFTALVHQEQSRLST